MTQTNTAIVLAAGQGTRLRPLTDTIPKAMVDIGGQPLLERIVRDLVGAGISRIVFVIGHLGERIETYFGRGSNWGAEFIYLRQQVLNGTGGALLLAEPYVSESFLVVFGDSYFDRGAVRSMMQAEHRCAIGIIKVSDPRRFGIVEVNRTGRITSIVEKPAAPKTNLAVAGIYKFDREIWPLLRTLQPSPRGELEIPDAVRRLVEKEYDVGAVELAFMADIGTHEDLQRIRNL